MGPPSSVNVRLHCCCMLPMTMQGSFRQCDNATMRSPFGLCWLHPGAAIRPVKCLIKRRHLRPSHAPYRAAKLRQISLSFFLSLAIALLQFFCGQQIAFTLIGFQMLSPWSHLLGALRLLPPSLLPSFSLSCGRTSFVFLLILLSSFILFALRRVCAHNCKSVFIIRF